MSSFIYAGVGARATPRPVLADMTAIAKWLAREGWLLATGGANGADAAFAAGAPADRRRLYLPWDGYNGHRGPRCHAPGRGELAAWTEAARRAHPAWDRCSDAVRKLHARNAAVLLGPALDRPVRAVVAWTPGGAVAGGAGLALRIAEARGVPVFNLALISPREACLRMRAIRLSA